MTDFLRLAKDAYDTAISFVDTNFRKQWENNLRMFQSKHPLGSKYLSESYKYRSKNFRPKTRSMVRSNEASAAAAFFSSRDALHVDPFNAKNPLQKLSAEIRSELLNHRLQYSIPWFQLLCGAMQDAEVQGIVCSKQYWDQETEDVQEDERGESGKLISDEGEVKVTVKQKVIKEGPVIELHPVENVLFDPGASWLDPVGTSPYLILLIPMHVYEVKERITDGEFNEVTDDQLKAARTNRHNTTRQAREGDQEDSKGVNYSKELSDFDIVWLHENFIRIKGGEKQYYTLGTEIILTDPKPLREVYWHGERPIVIGKAVIETHKPMPSSPVELGQGLQKEANEIANQRRDNVSLVLNKKYFVKRGAQVDLRNLVKNVAGGAVLMNDPASDVHEVEFADVTSSSYAEQDRINLDYDELVGNFSQSSVQTNRVLNETVGGMGLIKGASNLMTQYLIQTFSESWVEPVLRQLDLLEQLYESDEQLLQMIGEKVGVAETLQSFGIQLPPGTPLVTPQLLMMPAFIKVNLANSTSDPTFRLGQLLQAIEHFSVIAQNPPPGMDLEEVGKEIFGLLGYRDFNRFFLGNGNESPMVVMLQQKVQQLSQALESQQAQEQAKQQGLLAQQQMQHQADAQMESFRQDREDNRLTMKLNADRQLQLDKAKLLEDGRKDTETASMLMTMDEADQNRQLERDRMHHQRAMAQPQEDTADQNLQQLVQSIQDDLEKDEQTRDQQRNAILQYLQGMNDPGIQQLVQNLASITDQDNASLQ